MLSDSSFLKTVSVGHCCVGIDSATELELSFDVGLEGRGNFHGGELYDGHKLLLYTHGDDTHINPDQLRLGT